LNLRNSLTNASLSIVSRVYAKFNHWHYIKRAIWHLADRLIVVKQTTNNG